MVRRRSRALVALLVGAGLLVATAVGAEPLVRAVGPIGMTVADAERAAAFYGEVLGFEKVSDIELAGAEHEHLRGVFALRQRVIRMRLGTEEIELAEYLAPRGRPIPTDSRSNDRWFQHIAIVVGDMDRAYAWLRRHRVTHASAGPQRLPDWNPNAGGIRAFYFKDPDGHVLEAIWFPPGKGDPRWQGGTGLFLGIDHTAMVVGDTHESLRLYRDTLGLRVAGESENHGIEQERLNSVFGARLRITTLKAASGPAVELLEYLAPRDGRAMPADVRANDLVHWQVRLVVADPPAAERDLRRARATLVSPGLVSLPDRSLGVGRALLVRDPDGHALELAGD